MLKAYMFTRLQCVESHIVHENVTFGYPQGTSMSILTQHYNQQVDVHIYTLHTHTHIHIHICTHMHVYTYTYTHIYMSTYIDYCQ